MSRLKRFIIRWSLFGHVRTPVSTRPSRKGQNPLCGSVTWPRDDVRMAGVFEDAGFWIAWGHCGRLCYARPTHALLPTSISYAKHRHHEETSKGSPVLRNIVFTLALTMPFIVHADTTTPLWQAGVAVEVITPETPIPLVGYGAREKPFESVDTDIYAKALALADPDGNRGVIVTTDLVGVQAIFFEESCRRIMKRTGLERRQILLNASHNHTGPLLSLNPDPEGNLAYAAFSTEQAAQEVVAYTKWLQEAVARVAVEALENLAPASLAYGADRVEFVMNRRSPVTEGHVWMRPNPDGPTDKRVPVLSVASPVGKIRAVLLGCACHNTGLTADHNIISGDYAGYAQEYLEQELPGATALFMSGCGADANPEPRTDVPGVRKQGHELGEAVLRVLGSDMQPIVGNLSFAFERIDLPHMELDTAELAPYASRRTTEHLMAKHMIAVLESGKSLPTHYTAPLAVWGLGDKLTLVGLPSEVVSEYANQLYAAHPDRSLWVAAYCNDFFGYVPTARIVREGGHEFIGVTTYLWGKDLATKAGFFTEDVEPLLLDATKRLIASIQE